MSFRKTLAVISLVAFTSGCNTLEQNQPDVETVGKQIVADWKELPEVVAAEYEYKHGLDQGQLLYVDATVKEALVTSSAEQLEEIARRDYWRGTSWDVSLHVRLFSDANPPVPGKNKLDKIVHEKQIELTDAAELERKYGPRPQKK